MNADTDDVALACAQDLRATLMLIEFALSAGKLSHAQGQLAFTGIVSGRDALMAGELHAAQKWARFAANIVGPEPCA